MKKAIVLFFAMHSFIVLYAQKEDNLWYLAQYRALSFVSGSPVVISGSAMWGIEACAAIADKQGNLLFYTEGVDIWDANDQIMSNGGGLQSALSPTQLVIIPFPNDSNKYYLFHFTCPGPCAPPIGLNYTVVDMTLNGGLGDVPTGEKDLPLIIDDMSEKVMAVKHGNGNDWWIISHDKDSTYFVIPVTSSGIGATMTQTIGSDLLNYTGEMEISPNGEKLVSVDISGIVNLLDFDRCEGTLSNVVDMSKVGIFPDSSYYGCAFSPDNNLFYLGEYQRKRIFQYDLNATDISASEIIVYDTTLGSGIGGLQLGPDGKIYFGMINTGIGVIDNPNVLGTGCNASLTSLYSGNIMPLPTMPNYQLQAIACTPVTGIEELTRGNLQVFPNPFSDRTTVNFLNPNPDSYRDENLKLELYDMQGRLVKTIPNITSGEVVIQRGDLREGLYFFELSSEGGIWGSGKFVIE